MAMFLIFSLLAWSRSLRASSHDHDHIFMEKLKSRDSFQRVERSDALKSHEVMFVLKRDNADVVEKELTERSTPGGPNYQQWFTRQQVLELTQNATRSNAVNSWLQEQGLQSHWQSVGLQYMKVNAPISQWEDILHATFYQWEDKSRQDGSGNNIFFDRALEYSIPSVLQEHVKGIFLTAQAPPEIKNAPYRNSNPKTADKKNLRTTTNSKPSKQHLASTPTVTVAFLNQLYEIESNMGSLTLQQAVFETSAGSPQYYSADDLTLFQEAYNLMVQEAIDVNGKELNAPQQCSAKGVPNCDEANLDIQYIMGVAQNTTSIFWYVNDTTDPFVEFLQELTDTEDPPHVVSISYGSEERYQSTLVMTEFNQLAMELSLSGTTILVSSGDNGASGCGSQFSCSLNSGSKGTAWTGAPWTGAGYFPSFPATSPYVTAVGATMGPNGCASLTSEVVCQGDQGGIITSGGGFSGYYSQGTFQTAAIQAYFETVNGDSATAPTSGYNPYGRAYPDVSMIGVAYEVVIDGAIELLFGTSASAPVFAAMVSLVNSNRQANNLTTVGWINPTLYYNLTRNAESFTDITTGDNKCCAAGNGYCNSASISATCCQSGFTAVTGWDPATGFGSITLPQLSNLLGADIIYTDEPTSSSSDGNSFSLSTIDTVLVGVLVPLFCLSVLYFAWAYMTTKPASHSGSDIDTDTNAIGVAITQVGGAGTLNVSLVGEGTVTQAGVGGASSGPVLEGTVVTEEGVINPLSKKEYS